MGTTSTLKDAMRKVGGRKILQEFGKAFIPESMISPLFAPLIKIKKTQSSSKLQSLVNSPANSQKSSPDQWDKTWMSLEPVKRSHDLAPIYNF